MKKKLRPLTDEEYFLAKSVWRDCYSVIIKSEINPDDIDRDDPVELIYLYLKKRFEEG